MRGIQKIEVKRSNPIAVEGVAGGIWLGLGSGLVGLLDFPFKLINFLVVSNLTRFQLLVASEPWAYGLGRLGFLFFEF